jgi:hypothetical protein
MSDATFRVIEYRLSPNELDACDRNTKRFEDDFISKVTEEAGTGYTFGGLEWRGEYLAAYFFPTKAQA